MLTRYRPSRRVLLGVAALAPVLALPGCATVGRLDLADAISRLLTLSSQRALAVLLQPGGFYDSQVARIAVPDQWGRTGTLITQLLASAPVRDRLLRELNRAAERGADRAAPVIADAIRTLRVADALAVVRGDAGAATRLLEDQVGGRLIEAMVPAVGDALSIAAEPVVAQLLRTASGIDLPGLAAAVADQANRGLWRAIAQEEAAIRADPRSTNDPVLIAVFGLNGLRN